MSTSNMDPFDEFEFKPLTDGLGFNKKSVSLKESLADSGVLDDELQGLPSSVPTGLLDDSSPSKGKNSIKKHTFEEVLSALEKSPLHRSAAGDLHFTEPLPRAQEKKQAMDVGFDLPRPVQSPFPQSDAYKSPPIKRTPSTPPTPGPAGSGPSSVAVETPAVGTRRGAADSPQRRLIPTPINVPSAVLDLIVVVAFGIVFLVALLMVTKVNLSIVMQNLNSDPMIKISLGVLFVAIMQMYVVISRTFFGRTLGEWTFDLQVGEDQEQKSQSYPLKVALRSLLVTITGLIFLPLLSALVGRDITGQLSGVKLYRQRA